MMCTGQGFGCDIYIVCANVSMEQREMCVGRRKVYACERWRERELQRKNVNVFERDAENQNHFIEYRPSARFKGEHKTIKGIYTHKLYSMQQGCHQHEGGSRKKSHTVHFCIYRRHTK